MRDVALQCTTSLIAGFDSRPRQSWLGWILDSWVAPQGVAVRLLSDSKLEVREVAATTLSGLLKGASPAEAAQLRASFLSDVDRLFPRSRKRQKAKAGAEASGAALWMLAEHYCLFGSLQASSV